MIVWGCNRVFGMEKPHWWGYWVYRHGYVSAVKALVRDFLWWCGVRWEGGKGGGCRKGRVG